MATRVDGLHAWRLYRRQKGLPLKACAWIEAMEPRQDAIPLMSKGLIAGFIAH